MIWITVDVKLPDHAKMAELSSDAARWGWLVTLCKAKEQRKPGSFATERHYRHVLGKYGRYLKEYVKAGLIDREGEVLHVHDWRRHQWAAAKGNQEEVSENSGGNQEDASRAVSVPVSVSSTEEGVQGEEPDAAVAFRDRTGQFPGPVFLRWLNELSDAHGETRLVARINATPMTSDNPTTYLRLVRDALRLEDRRAERAERNDEQRRLSEKRTELRALPSANDVSEDEAKRLAAEYMAEARR